MAKARFIMSWGRTYDTQGKQVSMLMKRFMANRTKALLYDPQGMGNYFTYREAIDILGLDHTEVYKEGRIDLDPAEYSDLGWMCSYIGPPESAVEAMRAAVKAENIGPYPPDLLGELRDLAAQVKFRRERGPDFEVIGVEGAQGGIGFTLLSYVNPGDEVIMTDPAYFHFAPACHIPGGIPVRIPLRKENHFRYDIDEIKRHITTRTKMIIVTDPINPFGTVQSREFDIELLKLAWDHDIMVFNNITHNTYQIDPNVTQYPLASLKGEAPVDHVISTSGMSKGYGMAALRLGFLAGHPDLLKAAALTKMEITKIHTNLIAQYGAVAALRDKEYVRKAQEIMRRNIVHVKETVRMTPGLSMPVAPEYGFSCVIDVTGTEVTAQELCVALFKRKVAVYAGDGLGDVGAHEHIRINFSRPDIWAFETLRAELPDAIKEAQTGCYHEGVVKFFKEGQTERGRRIIAAVEANEERRRRLVPASGWVPASR
jgi:aspartate/methionine/tyrosine aminotransferase